MADFLKSSAKRSGVMASQSAEAILFNSGDGSN
jgi:hypothetical protein